MKKVLALALMFSIGLMSTVQAETVEQNVSKTQLSKECLSKYNAPVVFTVSNHSFNVVVDAEVLVYNYTLSTSDALGFIVTTVTVNGSSVTVNGSSVTASLPERRCNGPTFIT